jgi:phosphate butyryltransferase
MGQKPIISTEKSELLTMYKHFQDIVTAACARKPKRIIAIAQAAEEKMIQVAKEITDMDLCDAILVGNEDKIRDLAENAGLNLSNISILDEKDEGRAALRAVELVSSGRADVLVKGHMNTSDFLRSVLNREVGLRSGHQLNVLTCYDEPGQKKLFFMTDGGMTIAPTLEDKVEILKNAVPVLHNMGIKKPKVAILAANEKVNPKMPATMDAAALCEMAERGELPEAIYEGPIAFDVAMRPDAAEEKGIKSRISGDVDLFLVPNIEAGNCMGKAIGYFGRGQTAGIVVGARAPVVMSSRAASIEGKVTSIAWAILACGE